MKVSIGTLLYMKYQLTLYHIWSINWHFIIYEVSTDTLLYI